MIAIHIHAAEQTPLYEQIYREIKKQILEGKLKAGDKLPSTRSLAATLGVSRNTVDNAYYQLLAEGYTETFPKSGFYISDLKLASDINYIAGKSAGQSTGPKNGSMKQANQNRICSETIPDVREEDRIDFDFSPFAIDIDHFPYSIWKKLSRKTLEEDNDLLLSGLSDGDMKLRQAICDYVSLYREVHCIPEQIIVGAGADYLLQMLALTVQHMGFREITIENPCYRKAAMIFENNGLQLHKGTLDEGGLTAQSVSPYSELVYVTPSHQYPLGIVMPFGRRRELLAWANREQNHYIIEDDHDSEFRYKGKPIPSLQGMDGNDKVIYLGTFSKAIAPAIRVSYLILPPALSEAYHHYCGDYACTVSRLDQGILTRFLAEGYFEKHINRMRKIYHNKHDLVLELLKPLAAQDYLQIRGEHAGLHLVLDLKQGWSEDGLIAAAASQGIRLYGMKEHYLSPSDSVSESILFGYSGLTESEITEGIHRLSLILQHLLP